MLLGWNNKLRDDGRYSPALAVFHLDDIIGSAKHTGIAPSTGAGGHVEDAPYRFYLRMSTDGGWRYSWWSPEIIDGALHARTGSGLKYVVNLETGHVRVIATPLYRREYEERRQEDATLPPVEQRLVDLRDTVIIWTGS